MIRGHRYLRLALGLIQPGESDTHVTSPFVTLESSRLRNLCWLSRKDLPPPVTNEIFEARPNPEVVVVGTYRTSQIAAKCGIHPNTVRLYEEIGFIPSVPRAGNGYRLFSEIHLGHVCLVRTALKSTWLGGVIREKAVSLLRLSAAGREEEAMRLAKEHLALVREERKKAEIAATHLEAWAAISDDSTGLAGPYWKTNEVAERLDITRDMIRSWERNNLVEVPRDPKNGYRVCSEAVIRRLCVIRALRKARFSLMSIHYMLSRYDRGARNDLTGILDELPPGEEDIVFNTNQWLTKVKSIEESAGEIIDRLALLNTLTQE